jgi:hypothetical protein
VLDITTTRSLRGQRVRVTKHTADGQDAVYGVLQGATGKTIWVAGLPIELDLVIDVEAAPLMCSTCHRTATRLFVDDGRPTAVDGGPGVCAECYRKLAARRYPESGHGRLLVHALSRPSEESPRPARRSQRCPRPVRDRGRVEPVARLGTRPRSTLSLRSLPDRGEVRSRSSQGVAQQKRYKVNFSNAHS